MTEWLTCSGTAYVNDPATELPIDQALRFDLPQFTTPGLDPSSVSDLRRIVLGRSMLEMVQEFQNGVVRESALRRIAYAVPIPDEHSVQLYVCSDELCKLLADLDEQRVNDVACRWGWGLLRSPQADAVEPESLYQLRVRTLQQLVALSRTAASTGKKLMFRVEYRRHRGNGGTEPMRRTEETRH